MGERGRLPRDGRGDGKACRYQQGHRENRRATCSEAFQRLGDGALRSGFRIILAKTAERKTESFLFRRRRRNNPKKREVKGFEGWRFPQGNTTRTLTGSKRNGTAVASPSSSSCISYKTKTIINYRGKPHTQLLSVSESPSISPLPPSWRTGRKYCNRPANKSQAIKSKKLKKLWM